MLTYNRLKYQKHGQSLFALHTKTHIRNRSLFYVCFTLHFQIKLIPYGHSPPLYMISPASILEAFQSNKNFPQIDHVVN